MIDANIFRSYDIRGNSTINLRANDAYKIGYCFAKLNIVPSNSKICVGRDGRLSSPSLYKSLIQGLMDAGAEIIAIGVVPTPLLYFADKKFQPAASIMITGSHNPKDDNGFKMVGAGKPLYGQQLQNLLHNILVTDWSVIESRNVAVDEVNIDSEYINKILDNFSIDKNLKIAWDAGNGAAGEILEQLNKKLPNYNLMINCTIDGNFPNHHADPSVASNLTQLIDNVKANNCHFGIAFDGDADRIGVVTANGAIVWGDQLIYLFACDILKYNPKATIIADVKTSKVVFDQIETHNGYGLMWKTGHSHIKSKMQETGALFAGEMSGHLFFADKYYGYDDAIYAAIRLLELISRSNTTLEEIISNLPVTYSTPEIKIYTDDSAKFDIIEHIKSELREAGTKFNDIDGIRVDTRDYWWLLRASNTQNAIIARYEATTSAQLQTLGRYLKKLLQNYNLELDIADN